MQGGRGGRDPFSNFGDAFGGFGGFGGSRSLLSNFFGGRDPFDDPFFTRPFGSMFESSFFGPGQSPLLGMHPTGFIEYQAPEPKKPRGPIIEELNSDDEKEESDKEKKGNPRKHGRSNDEPYVEVPDDEAGQSERRNRHLQYMNGYNSSYHRQEQLPQTRSFMFQSSTVTYGGANGAYYTSSKTRRTGSDGVTFEESKEADTATGQASHQVSRGLNDKGHSVMRKLNSDGRVDTMQSLHNLNEGIGLCGQNDQAGRGGWALPSTENLQQSGRVMLNARDRSGPSRSQGSTRMKDSKDFKDKSSHSQGKQRG